MSFDPIRHCIAFLRRQNAGEVLHHAGIGVHASEGLAVRGRPCPEGQAGCFDKRRPGRHLIQGVFGF
jgi:hypothetical protein